MTQDYASPKKRISKEELKRFKTFEDKTDEELEEIINSLENVANLFYQLFIKQKEIEQN